MTEISDVVKISLPSYYLRVKTKHGGVFKRETGLIGKDEASALLSVKKLFDNGSSIDKWEEYYLAKRYWVLPASRGADMVIEEAKLKIEEKANCNWTVKRISDFFKVLQ